MSNFDYDAHKALANQAPNSLEAQISAAKEKAHMGHFLVCTNKDGEVVTLTAFAASMRDDITVVYDTDAGYSFNQKSEG